MSDNLHKNHRARVKEKFLNGGFAENTSAHEILELLLFYAIPQKDTNPIAHRLINEFGSLSAVFDAPAERLTEVEGVSLHTAALIKLVPQICAQINYEKASKKSFMNTPEEFATYLNVRYAAVNGECFSVICLDSTGRLLGFKFIGQGSNAGVDFNLREVLKTVINCKATAAVIAHNHTGGVLKPSEDDITATLQIKSALSNIGTTLADHIILANGSYISLAETTDIF